MISELNEVVVVYLGMFWSGGGLFQQWVTVVFGDEEMRKLAGSSSGLNEVWRSETTSSRRPFELRVPGEGGGDRC
jgi:hypothetical protein